MNITKTMNGEQLIIGVSGRIDSATAPELQKEIEGSITSVKDLVLDLKDLLYTASAGLRVILNAQKTMNKQGKMTLINVSEEVLEVFNITGFLDILTIE